MADRDPVLVSAVRTPIGRFLGGLSSFSATQLGSIAIREAVKRAGIDVADVDEVIMGNVVTAGEGQAPARQAALHGGIPADVPAVTINKVCGSGLKAVMLASQAIKAGDGDLYIAGGMESMSNAPYLLPKARTGYRMGNAEMIDAVVHDGLWCAFEGVHMGEEAEIVAEKYEISREAQDQFAYESHKKAAAATEAGRFHDEMVPVEIPQKKGAALVIDKDESIRPDTNIETLGRLNPVFRKEYGTVTAGNAPGLNDGGAATVVASEAYALAHDLPVLARITGYAAAAIEPKYIFACPPRAVRKLLRPHRHEDERLRRDRGQRGLFRAGARQRQGARLGLGQGQPERRRGRAGPSHRRERRACAGDAGLRAAAAWRRQGPGDALPRRRRRGRALGRGLAPHPIA